ncbi:hypothetical protein J3R30DRAFT_3707372 [Lentinula aciculospora]|uniref:Uncharacterized protein n=1 Tax=Lentinula aciculospora TaxID=153920 RepID=A0A9W9A4M3_9AGAR|nr:hypothetical protein J3R30DRAFT_3707372 [Lentinula aciculospora]
MASSGEFPPSINSVKTLNYRAKCKTDPLASYASLTLSIMKCYKSYSNDDRLIIGNVVMFGVTKIERNSKFDEGELKMLTAIEEAICYSKEKVPGLSSEVSLWASHLNRIMRNETLKPTLEVGLGASSQPQSSRVIFNQCTVSVAQGNVHNTTSNDNSVRSNYNNRTALCHRSDYCPPATTDTITTLPIPYIQFSHKRGVEEHKAQDSTEEARAASTDNNDGTSWAVGSFVSTTFPQTTRLEGTSCFHPSRNKGYRSEPGLQRHSTESECQASVTRPSQSPRTNSNQSSTLNTHNISLSSLESEEKGELFPRRLSRVPAFLCSTNIVKPTLSDTAIAPAFGVFIRTQPEVTIEPMKKRQRQSKPRTYASWDGSKLLSVF